MSKPLLSICLITYKQEDFIQQAIKSVFEQEFDFPIEFIISNDCSPDKTHEKIVEITKDAPEIFTVKYFNHTENLGMMKNFSFAINQCKGKYIAYFEGDDYWCYNKKLQTQIRFLEENPDYAICCHNLKFLQENSIIENVYIDKLSIKETSSLEDLAQHNFIPTLTAVFRNVEEKIPKWILDSPIGDLPMFMAVARHGKIKFINQKWAVYRYNIGEWSKMGNKKNLNMIKQYDLLIDEFRNQKNVVEHLQNTKSRYIKEYLRNEKATLHKIMKNPYFKQLSLSDKIKFSFKKMIS